MNHTRARCGHYVLAIGSPGSSAREKCERMPCDRCRGTNNEPQGPEPMTTARDFAIAAHGDQKYGDDPYVRHLDDVARIVEPFGEEAVTLAYLHDVAEDTPVTIEQIAEKFGVRIAQCVAYLTDEPGRNRRERKSATNTKLAKVPDEFGVALLVKIADRVANVEESKRTKDSRLERTASATTGTTTASMTSTPTIRAAHAAAKADGIGVCRHQTGARPTRSKAART